MKFKKAIKLMQKGEKLSSEIMDEQYEYVYYNPEFEQFCYTHRLSGIYVQYIFDIEDILNREWNLFEGEA